MNHSSTYHNQPPRLFSLYGKALLPKPGQPGNGSPLPEVSARLLGVATGGPRLDLYRRVCGFTRQRAIPPTWPHVLAFPLHLKVLTDPGIPFPLLGLVHLRNRIIQHRPIYQGENLDIEVSVGQAKKTEKGLEFELITQASSAGSLIWEENSTTLFRQSDAEAGCGKNRKAPPELKVFNHSFDLQVPESTGRQYAAASGDRNPIHLYPLTARLFGFPRAIAHGMWSKAKVLSLLQQQPEWTGGAFDVSCDFKKPLFLPGKVKLNWQSARAGLDYQLLNGAGTAPHLSGRVQWLDG